MGCCCVDDSKRVNSSIQYKGKFKLTISRTFINLVSSFEVAEKMLDEVVACDSLKQLEETIEN